MSSAHTTRDARRRERYALVLDQVRVASDLLSSFGDIGPVNVPMLKGAAELVGNIVNIAQTMITNKDYCASLVEEISKHLTTITNALKGKNVGRVEPAFQDVVDEFALKLREIQSFVEELSSRSWAKRLMATAKDKRQIDGYKAQLVQIFRNVNLADMIHVVYLTPNASRLYGRDEVLKQAAIIVVSRHVALLGAGGIGKTIVALALLRHPHVEAHFADNRFFIPCDAIKSARGLTTAILEILLGFAYKAEKDLIAQLMGCLSAITPVILVLDNFETVYYGSDSESESVQIETVLQHMSNIPGVSIVITMRGDTAPEGLLCESFHLPTLLVDDARDMFIAKCGHDIQPEEADSLQILLHKSLVETMAGQKDCYAAKYSQHISQTTQYQCVHSIVCAVCINECR
ncbi:hypothetical protein EW026_g1400 [Hermanssonia centrifuga]|uniref:Novel STAND NTPase 1 domain-containing protein n=1 Tax=Hermanssonia centrifuga TaxID=98765 RepID=A0A4S4KW60_9APHY|nr:hypothetical protein EW026_g1400 [Hermanssonia centrifuga]